MKKWLIRAYKRYVLDALGAMALGLFASLVIGLILTQISQIPGFGWIAAYTEVLAASSPVVGAAIGVAVAYGLKVKPLAIFSSAATGALGYNMAGPVGCFLAAVVGAELGNLVAGRTKVDIIAVPIVTIVAGGLTAQFTSPGVNSFMVALRNFIEVATLMSPVQMGIIVSVVMGLALTAPISSAALAAMIFVMPGGGELSQGLKLAAGAATVGCSAQMVGFAVVSFKENRWNGLISQGLGTSMLQISNIMRHPAILVPPTLASAIIGPLATTVFPMYNAGAAAGMGTSGLVGQFGTWAAMAGTQPAAIIIIKILALHIVLPAALSLLIAWFMVKRGWIKSEYYKLEM